MIALGVLVMILFFVGAYWFHRACSGLSKAGKRADDIINKKRG
jgi:hypothetical protein